MVRLHHDQQAYRRITKMGYANRIPRVKPLLKFLAVQEAADLGHGEASTGQLDSGLGLSSLMSFFIVLHFVRKPSFGPRV